MRVDATVGIGVEFVLDEPRQARTTRVHLGRERLIVFPHQQVERRLFGTAALVVRCAGDRALWGCAHG